MEVSSSNGLNSDVEEKALNSLLDVFGSMFTLQEIASAYCNAGRNVDMAGEFLFDQQASVSTSTTQPSNGEARCKESSESINGNISETSYQANGKFRASKTKGRTVSAGTISSVIGKDYAKSVQPANGSFVATKPLKLDKGEEAKPNPPKNDLLPKDMEDFLFKLLGEGFQMERGMVREVLESCGYDMKKSMLKLLDSSEETLDRRTESLDRSSEKFTEHPNSEGLDSQRNLQQQNSSGCSGDNNANKSGTKLPKQSKERNELQKEVLAALFCAPEKFEELPKRTQRAVAVRRSRAFGTVVSEPPRDFIPEPKANVFPWQEDGTIDEDEDEDEDDGYQALRKAVMEYRGMRKVYYEAAVAAFASGNRDRADQLMEEGHRYHEKACQADDESNQKIVETRNAETESNLLLDLHDFEAKEAIRLLKCHLSRISGISSFKYLKVILETNDADNKKGTCRRQVMKLLNKESIEWIEEGNPGTILIRTDIIDPKRLSFTK